MAKGYGFKVGKLNDALDSDEAMVRQQREQAAQVNAVHIEATCLAKPPGSAAQRSRRLERNGSG